MNSLFLKFNAEDKKAVWVVLGIGLLLRLLGAWNSLYLTRADEVQYWDMAHHLVYGDGFISWEYSVGARSFINLWPNSVPLLILKCIGITKPLYYIPIIKSFYCVISMLVPLGMMQFARLVYDKKVAFYSLVLGCFWYELILSASHGLTEYYSVYCTFGAFALFGLKRTNFNYIFIGMLLGLALIFRPHNLIPVSIASLFLLIKINDKQSKLIILGGAVSIVLGLSVDILTWHGFASSYLLYARCVNAIGGLLGNNPGWQHLYNLAYCSLGLFIVALIFGIINIKKHYLNVLIGIATLVFFSLQGIQEYSYILIIIPFLLCIIAFLIVHTKSKGLQMGIVCFYFAATFLGCYGALSTSYFQAGGSYQRRNGIFYKDPWLETTLALSNLPGGSVLWAMGDGVAAGGYYVFHHHFQMFFPSGVPAHAELIKDHDIHDFVRYLVAPLQPNGIAGFHLLKNLDGFCIYENDRLPIKQEIDGYAYEFQLPVEKPAINLLLQNGLIKSRPPFTYWH